MSDLQIYHIIFVWAVGYQKVKLFFSDFQTRILSMHYDRMFQSEKQAHFLIYAMEAYKKHREYFSQTGQNLSVMLHTDGAPLFKSTNKSMWSLQAYINELIPQER